MRRLHVLMGPVAAMLLAASSAFAGNLHLAWDNCASEGGVANKTSACTSNTGNAGVLVGSFQPNADIVGVTGIEIVLDYSVRPG